MRDHNYYIYIMASNSGTLYTGLTDNLERRCYEHKHHLIKGFTRKYDCVKLVYFEHFTQVVDAIAREKEIKGWLRSKKEALINKANPRWEDLSIVALSS